MYLSESNLKKVYFRLAEGEFKTNCFDNHKQSFSNQKYSKSTTLSAHLRNIKRKSNERIDLKWEILRQAAPYSNITKSSLLCLHEKLAISLCPNPEELLNKRTEMISKCRHQNKFLLMNFNPND